MIETKALQVYGKIENTTTQTANNNNIVLSRCLALGR